MPFKLMFFLWSVLLAQPACALQTEDLLPPEQAFRVSATAVTPDKLEVVWDIAEGYSVYRNNLRFSSKTEHVELGAPLVPAGNIKHDGLLGEIEHYHDRLAVAVPLTNRGKLATMQLLVRYQACSEQGICYPPQKKTLSVALPQDAPPAKANPLAQWVKGLPGFTAAQDELLPPEQAFRFFATVKDAQTLHVNWEIAPAYYLYREKIQLALRNASGVQLGDYRIPGGTPKHDEAFGQVEIFHDRLEFDVPLARADSAAQAVTLDAKFQGCADRGVCYPPMSQSAELALPAAQHRNAAEPAQPALSEQDDIARALRQDSLGMTLLVFFGFGLLLSLTPCIFPMIPILSGIIVGHGHNITTRRAFLLSLSYVLASALAYTLFGVLAALFGGNLQSAFQQPWIIVLFSAIFVLLSLSMFGFYHLELPKSVQLKLHNSSEKHRDGSMWGAAIMGALSSLIVGPCVAAPLAGALIFIGQTGDVLLGGSALFMMGLGMGVPLLLLGASAGKWLPKAGEWLITTKAVFGVVMLAVAVWMLSRILPAEVTMLLAAALFIVPSIYLDALEPLPAHSSGWRRLFKGLGVMMLVCGLMLLIGVGMGNGNPLKPLQGFAVADARQPDKPAAIPFERITSLTQLDGKIQQAMAAGQPVMLDYYADWCISCKEMETYTFTDARVKAALSGFMLVKADVTENSDDSKALLAQFGLIGPPATLFFGADGKEIPAQRVIGYQDADTFLAGLQRIRP